MMLTGVYVLCGIALIQSAPAPAKGFSFEGNLALLENGRIWLNTMTTPFNAEHKDDTYKVYTHVYDFAGLAPITKGSGGTYPHHRGLFIGWRNTKVGDKSWDTWVMTNSSQRHVSWLVKSASSDVAKQSEEINWCDDMGQPFIREIRTITAHPGEKNLRLIDFTSELHSLAGAIQLRGDHHHGGMQVRLAEEVAQDATSTLFILPEGAEKQENDKIIGAWWVCCNAKIGGKAYWVLHMTPKNHPAGAPVYGIRTYGRFGSFTEPDLEEGKPLLLTYRIVFSEQPLDQQTCGKLYQEYSSEGGKQ